jgi:hypothetical protein
MQPYHSFDHTYFLKLFLARRAMLRQYLQLLKVRSPVVNADLIIQGSWQIVTVCITYLNLFLLEVVQPFD